MPVVPEEPQKQAEGTDSMEGGHDEVRPDNRKEFEDRSMFRLFVERA